MIETLSQNQLSLVLIFPVVTLTVFVVGIIRIDLAKFQQKQDIFVNLLSLTKNGHRSHQT